LSILRKESADGQNIAGHGQGRENSGANGHFFHMMVSLPSQADEEKTHTADLPLAGIKKIIMHVYFIIVPNTKSETDKNNRHTHTLYLIYHPPASHSLPTFFYFSFTSQAFF
jgi:hypothetical protein